MTLIEKVARILNERPTRNTVSEIADYLRNTDERYSVKRAAVVEAIVRSAALYARPDLFIKTMTRGKATFALAAGTDVNNLPAGRRVARSTQRAERAAPASDAAKGLTDAAKAIASGALTHTAWLATLSAAERKSLRDSLVSFSDMLFEEHI